MKNRHNAVSDIIRETITKTLHVTRIHEDSTVRGPNQRRLTGESADQKPDLWFRHNGTLVLIEITCPYANGPDTLTDRYQGKRDKYAHLVDECERTFNERVQLITVVVSSLGAILSESKKELKSLLHSKTVLQKMLKKIVVATLRESLVLLNRAMSTGEAPELSDSGPEHDSGEEDAPQRGDELGDNAGDLPNWQRDANLTDSDSEVIPEENPIIDRLFQSDGHSSEHSSDYE